jgi:nucleotide-sensitive chloride channel 1A
MLPSTIHTAPSIDSFTSLSDHQSQTPSTFYGAKPVLHYHAVGARAISSRNHVIKLPIFPQSSDAIQAANGEAGTDQGEVGDGTPIEALVDVFISSE